MKRLLIAAALAATSASAFAQVGVSVVVAQPGVFGRIDIGNFPQPQIIYPQPVIIQPVAVAPQPIYMNVPPGHAKKWRKHCYKYNACGVPVYFVQPTWYQQVYAPTVYPGQAVYPAAQYQNYDQGEKHGKHGKHEGEGHGKHGKHEGKGRDRD